MELKVDDNQARMLKALDAGGYHRITSLAVGDLLDDRATLKAELERERARVRELMGRVEEALARPRDGAGEVER